MVAVRTSKYIAYTIQCHYVPAVLQRKGRTPLTSSMNDEITRMYKRIEELEQRLTFFEQLVFRDYIRLLELYREKLSREENDKQFFN